MNLYDFDETIYDGDSTRDFVLYCYRHYPRTLAYLPRQLAAVASYMAGKIDKTTFKERYFSMFAAVPDIDAAVADFWDSHAERIMRYYPRQARQDDVVISASPEFILRPLCARLGLTHVLASDVDKHTGRFIGANCYGAEKVRRFAEAGYDLSEVEQVYSDSLSDTPIAELGREAFIVHKDGSLGPWEAPKQKGLQGFFTLFNKREALLTIACGAVHLLTAGHAAKVVVREKKWPVPHTYGTIFGLNAGSILACLALAGKKNAVCKRVAHAFSILVLPLGAATVGIATGLSAILGAPVLALGVATVAGLPLLYKGTALLFRKEIAQMQATQHLKEGQDK